HRWPIRYVHLVRWQAMSRLRRRPKRWPSLPPDAVDALCAVVLIVVGVASVFGQSLEASDGTVIYDKPGLLAAVTAALTGAPFAFRRRAPLTALSVSTVAIFVHILTGWPEGVLPLPVL